MQLDRWMSGTLAAGVVATAMLAFGCSGSLHAPSAASGPQGAALSSSEADVTGTTSLMSAQVLGPAPRVGKVGKAQIGLDESFESASGASDADAPKNVRHSDGSRRGGGFGSSKN